RMNQTYSPIETREAPFDPGTKVTFRFSSDLYTKHDTADLARLLGVVGRNNPNIYYIGLNSDTVCPSASVQKLYRATRAPVKGYIGLEGVGHDYRHVPALIESVDLAIEWCLGEKPLNEVWGVALQAAKRCVAEVLHGDPAVRRSREEAIRIWD